MALGSDVVPLEAAIVGIITGGIAIIFTSWSFYEYKEGVSVPRNWAIGAIVFAALVILVGIDELIPGE